MTATDPSVPPVPPDDDARVEALRALDLLGGEPQERFDRLTRLASRLFDVPIALVNLIDRDEQRSLSCLGLPTSDMPRAQSFCAHAIASSEPLVIPDLAADPRFAASPLVTGPDGLRFYAGHPLAAPSGHRIGTLCIVDTRPRTLAPGDPEALRDLALLVEREVAEARLDEALAGRRSAEARLRAVVESAAEGIVTTTGDGLVEYANPAAGRILGMSSTEAVGRSAAELLGGCGETPGTGTAEWRRVGTDEVVPVEYTAAAIGDGGGLVVTFRDVSERRGLEQLRERFVATVSHDLRTPLSTAAGYLEVLLDGLAGDLEPKQRAYAEQVASSVGRLRGHIEDLLLGAELDAGDRPSSLQPADLGALAGEVEAELRHTAVDRGVELTLDAGPAPVTGDPARLRRAIASLVGAGIRCSPPERVVTVRAYGDAEGGVVEVTGAGSGLPAAELWLAVAREIAEQHGGRLEIGSPQGNSTTARLCVPASPPVA